MSGGAIYVLVCVVVIAVAYVVQVVRTLSIARSRPEVTPEAHRREAWLAVEIVLAIATVLALFPFPLAFFVLLLAWALVALVPSRRARIALGTAVGSAGGSR